MSGMENKVVCSQEEFLSGHLTAMGIGYTLATGNLFCSMDDFRREAEVLLGRPIFTHEFADTATWSELRKAFEERALASLTP